MIEQVDVKIGNAKDLGPDDLELTITMRGKPELIVKALVHGLPRDVLEQMDEAIQGEIRRRAQGPPRV